MTMVSWEGRYRVPSLGKFFMSRNPFLRAIGLVAVIYIILKALSWGANSAFWILQSLSYWVRWTLLPHAWQVALAAGVIYLLLTALTTSKD